MKNFSIPMADLRAQHRSLREDIDTAIAEVFEKSAFIGGAACMSLEAEFSHYCGTRHACGVASGSDALYLSLAALDLGPEDEVITTPFTFTATAEAVARTGARIVFADIDEQTFNLDPNSLEKVLSSRTKAVVPVHLYGLPANILRINEIAHEHNLFVVEDAAQAHGAMVDSKKVGSFGISGCFSFFPSKNLGALGDGGMVVSNDKPFIDKVRKLANHGSKAKYVHEMEGISSRLDALQAAVLRIKLKHLDLWNAKRQQLASCYQEALASVKDISLPTEIEKTSHVYHLFTIRTRARDELSEHLCSKGFASAIHYPMGLHLQKSYQYLGYKKGSFPNAELASQEVLSLPIYPEMTQKQVELISSEVQTFFS